MTINPVRWSESDVLGRKTKASIPARGSNTYRNPFKRGGVGPNA